MNEFLQYTVLGLVVGGVYAIAASGLVVTYTTSGIFNFAHGAIAMLGAFLYWQVRFDWGWPAPIALLVVLGGAAPLLGVLLYVGIMRGLRGTSEATQIVVPISVMLGFLALATWIWNPTPNQPRVFRKFFGDASTVSIFGVNITYHELLSLALAGLIAVALRMYFARTRSGVAMRAVVDDPSLLELNGGRPERLAAMSWALGAALAALAGILITPIQGGAISANALTLLVLDATAAAVFGRLRSVPRTFVGAIILGLSVNYVLAYFPTQWTWVSNLRPALPMLFLFVFLLVLPQSRLRGSIVARSRERFRLPSMQNAYIAAATFVIGMFLLRGFLAPTAISNLSFGMTLAIVALSLVMLTGYAGEINLAALSFGALGTIMVFHFGTTGTGPAARTTLLGFVVAAVFCALVGALVALPALRLRGLYLALATLAFGIFVSDMVLQEIGERKLPLLHTSFSIFPNGALVVPRPKFGPFDFNADRTFLMFLTVVFALLGVGLIAFRRGNYGRRLTALRDSPAAAATLGMNVVRMKLLVFMLSAAIAGVGGVLMSAQLGSVNLDRFNIFLSLSLLMLTVVGGIGYVSGGLFGGLLLGVGFAALDSTFTKIGTDHATLQSVFHFLSSFTTVLPALIGVTMARNPSGVVHDVVTNFRVMARSKRFMIGAVVLGLGLYTLRLTDVIDNWFAVVLTLIILLLLPVAARALIPDPVATDVGPADETPLEFIGLDRPFTIADRNFLDDALSMHTDSAIVHAAVGVRASGSEL